MTTAAIDIETTVVFHKNWNAIHAKIPDPVTGKPVRRYRYIVNKGSSRSSKTYSIIDVLDTYARESVNKRITVWRDTKTDCKKTVLFDTELRLKSTNRFLDLGFNKTESILTYPLGATLEIHGADEVNSVHGLTQSVAWFNEPYKISRAVFDQIDQRTSDFIIIDWNPRLAHWIEDIEKDPRTLVIHSTFKDNPFCPTEQRNKILSYQPVSLCRAVLKKKITEKEALNGLEPPASAGLTPGELIELKRCQANQAKNSANAFNWQVYGLGLKGERPNRIYRWTEISRLDYDALDVPRYYYSDWGAVDPWAVGEVKYYDGAIYIKELNYESENLIRERLTATERTQLGAEDEGLVSWLFARLGIDYDARIVCDSNRPLKILALRKAGWEYSIAAVKRTGSIVDGIDTINNLKVYYTSDSVNVKYEQENYSRGVDRYGVILEEPDDVDNHHMDGVRYVVSFLQAEGIINIV